MTALLCILSAIAVNFAVGVFLLTRVLDHAEQAWVERCPIPGGFFVVVSLWPGVLYLHWRHSAAVEAMTPAERRSDLIASTIAAVIMGAIALAVVAFVVFLIAAVVYSVRLDNACIDAGGIPTRQHDCLKPDAFIRMRP